MFRNLTKQRIIKSTLFVVAGGGGGFCLYELFRGEERFHREVVIPLVHRFVDAERTHRMAVILARNRLLPMGRSVEYPSLRCQVWNLTFENPIGLAAGFDKNAEALKGLSGHCGFGSIEIGSVTPHPQSGNDPPRVFRLREDEAVINRYGFNSDGHRAVLERLKSYRAKRADSAKLCVVGLNLGKNRDTSSPLGDYSVGVMTFVPFVDYVVINISSPNTPGLRQQFQTKKELERLLKDVNKARDQTPPGREVPLLLKVSPDLSNDEKADIASVCLNKKAYGVDGLIVSNTTISRPESLQSPLRTEEGGLSGRPLKNLSTKCIRDFYRLTDGKVPIVGCGGVSNGEDAYEKIRAGASLVQLYTALVYQGFPVVGRIKRELAQCLKRDGFASVVDAIGVDARTAGGKK